MMVFTLIVNSMAHKDNLGKAGEQHALLFLQQKGHTIVQTNYRFSRKEVDIISIVDDILVFTEIKTRSHYQYGFPEEAVGKRKQDALKCVAQNFCLSYPELQKIRFDVISILIQENCIKEVLHFEDAFY